MRNFVVFLFGCCLGTSLIAGSLANFSYEPGNCEFSLFQVVQDMFKSEMRAFINPNIRQSPNKHLQYDLYTPLNPNERQILKLGDKQLLKQSNFNAKWPVRFSIHGWTGKSLSCSNAAIKDAYLSRGNFNVIIVDWSTYSLDISYIRITKQLSAIAKSLVKFTQFLNHETGIDYAQMYLIGHSAGSHLAGLAGKMLKPQQYGAIFALDPAGLTQLRLSEKFRLAPSDASYVESIHTDVTLLGNPNYAMSQAAFFPNWGQGQPHCPNATATEFDIACDHFSAIYYFAESVRNPTTFGALKCKKPLSLDKFNCGCSGSSSGNSTSSSSSNKSKSNKTCSAVAFMGGEPAIQKSGVFYLSTREQKPFGYGNKVHLRRARTPTFLASRYMPRSLTRSFYFDIS